VNYVTQPIDRPPAPVSDQIGGRWQARFPGVAKPIVPIQYRGEQPSGNDHSFGRGAAKQSDRRSAFWASATGVAGEVVAAKLTKIRGTFEPYSNKSTQTPRRKDAGDEHQNPAWHRDFIDIEPCSSEIACRAFTDEEPKSVHHCARVPQERMSEMCRFPARAEQLFGFEAVVNSNRKLPAGTDYILSVTRPTNSKLKASAVEPDSPFDHDVFVDWLSLADVIGAIWVIRTTPCDLIGSPIAPDPQRDHRHAQQQRHGRRDVERSTAHWGILAVTCYKETCLRGMIPGPGRGMIPGRGNDTGTCTVCPLRGTRAEQKGMLSMSLLSVNLGISKFMIVRARNRPVRLKTQIINMMPGFWKECGSSITAVLVICYLQICKNVSI